MAKARVAMHSIEEVLRLHHECGRSQREIARSCGLSTGTVNKLLRLAVQAGVGWPLPPALDTAQLEERLYGRPGGSRRSRQLEDIDFAAVHKQLQAIENAPQHKVDGSVAAVPRVDYVRIYGKPPNGAAYAAGERIEGQVRFNIPVEVGGSPRLALNVGGRTRHATLYRQSSDGSWQNFRSEVQSQDIDADGISIPANALQLNGGSIRRIDGEDAYLNLGSHAIANAKDHKVNGGG